MVEREYLKNFEPLSLLNINAYFLECFKTRLRNIFIYYTYNKFLVFQLKSEFFIFRVGHYFNFVVLRQNRKNYFYVYYIFFNFMAK